MLNYGAHLVSQAVATCSPCALTWLWSRTDVPERLRVRLRPVFLQERVAKLAEDMQKMSGRHGFNFQIASSDVRVAPWNLFAARRRRLEIAERDPKCRSIVSVGLCRSPCSLFLRSASRDVREKPQDWCRCHCDAFQRLEKAVQKRPHDCGPVPVVDCGTTCASGASQLSAAVAACKSAARNPLRSTYRACHAQQVVSSYTGVYCSFLSRRGPRAEGGRTGGAFRGLLSP